MEANASENSKLSESPVANAEENRVEDAAMSDSLSSVQTDDEKAKDEDEETVDGTPEERMTLALSCKDAGNDVFKSGDVSAAKAKYTEGLKQLKDLDFPDAKRLRVALNSNVAMCCIKTQEWSAAIAAANAVLQEEPENVKALYRRGVARSAFGFYAEAKADLLQVARLDPKNADARKELEKVKERIAKHNAEKKKAFSGLFDRAAGMYADREEQMRQKRLQEEEEEKRRQEMWEKEMEERREKGEEEISFADWKEERRKVEEEKKDKQRREQTSSPSSSPSTTASSGRTSKKTGGVESLELDEEDEKIINETKKMGYCYFRRDLTEEEKKLNAQHRPTRIEPAANAATSGASAGSSPVASNAENSAGGAAKQSGVSSWNSAGTTYEEKDVSEWAKKRFEARLKEAKVLRGNDIDSLLQNPEHLVNTLQGSAKGGDSADPLASLQKLMGQFMQTEIKCKEVTGLTGDAQVVVMRGTKRFLFEFACTVVFEVSGELSLPDSGLVPTAGDKDGTKFSYKGEITLPEVSSADGKGEAWLTGSRIKMKQKVDPRNQPIVDECIEAFKKQLVHQIHQFLSDFSKIA
ncbi:tetratricopeptide repeat-containing protein [Toxoplasma gondii TgCatPRC2]|uniref:peptidylprolyl isomerase n=9 Tax=Toxoplasma gondii TaxID=5811 RepID=B6K996_TOXGV|nr:tetratricopeptide repeat-containing protein [Toxoplasma gondii ME49]ESS35200.1 tetratricopeptide repeat-containing protein [Toxoplasma gondii VEG]KFG37604.1 tetratricopeptide repeat-containing protein [Toxoplasma gondii GAB2-2007-GAL-DOM2]KFH17705.1 tetratricopeptide repeat-containing protein [Toxoplasma gondii MAS]KYF48573.1 tetratricopeptide repeat-containing protein [Toxoplasma gondii ARI]KYK65405.1 tetratricopeptide repeat-containing protein [Toxoplasma gondii TgCatPRC2]PIM00663.1 tetr|eukprot:XP_002364620.1 tetratricopeptide repeat-containing protein [Toxoplasma gondii ME49]